MTESRLTRSEQKRQDILTAARVAFQADGVQAVSMDMLARLAGVSKRTVYNHFASKEALVTHLMREMWQQAIQDIAVDYDPKLALADQLHQIIAAEIAIMGQPDYVSMARMAFGHFFYQPEVLVEEMQKWVMTETALIRWLKAATADQRLSCHDISLAEKQLHSLIKGSVFWPQLMQLAPPLTPPECEALAMETVKMFLARYAL